MKRLSAMFLLAVFAGIGAAEDAMAQRQLIDVTMEVVDDVAGIDAIVLQLEDLETSEAADGPEDDSAGAPAGDAERDSAGSEL